MTRIEGRRDRLFEAAEAAAKIKDPTSPNPADDPDRYKVKAAYPGKNIEHQLDSGTIAKLTGYFGGHFAESFGIRLIVEPDHSGVFDTLT